MREIGEQWIEKDYGGRPHMYKAVGVNDKFDPCIGCCNQGNEEECYNAHSNCGRGVVIIKDLGPVNEEGCLACPFCGAFPIVRCIEEQEGECIVAQAFCPKGDLEIQEPEGKGHVLWFMRTTLQQTIDAWNRRV